MTAWTHVIWDWNGTLFDDVRLGIDIMNGMLRRRGMAEMTLARYQQVFDFPVKEYYRRLGFDFARESFEALGTEFIDAYERRKMECGLQPLARETLDRLRASGRQQAVLSAYRHATLEDILRAFAVRDHFALVVGSDDHYAHGKIEQGRWLLKELGCVPGQAVLIGDTVHDADVARALGIACVLVTSGYHGRTRLVETGYPVIDSLAELRV